MTLNTSHIETLIEAYTEAATQAQCFADKYGQYYVEESEFYAEQARKYLSHATAATALDLDKALQDTALYAAECRKLDHDDKDAARKYFEVRKALWN